MLAAAAAEEAEEGRRTARALSGRRPVRKEGAAAALPTGFWAAFFAAFSVSLRRSNAAWSAWLGAGAVGEVEGQVQMQMQVQVGAGLVAKAQAEAGAGAGGQG